MFKFKLDPLLNHRKHLEDDCQKVLAALRGTLARETEALERLQRQRVAQERGLRRLKTTGPDIAGIVATMAFIERLSAAIDGQQRTVAEAREACDNQRCELVQAMKGRKIIEKLKEKGLEDHRQEAVRTEQNFMNEIAINRFTRITR
jgi:flagellar protein FliJ